MARSSVSRLKRKGRGSHRMTWGVRIIPPRTKTALLSGASAAVLAAALIANPSPSFAADECGAPIGGKTWVAMFEAIKGSNASSAMLESRGGLMVDRVYEGYDSDKRRESKALEAEGKPATRGMANRVRQIARMAKLATALGGNYPLLDAMNGAYAEAVEGDYGAYDIAEVFEYLMDGHEDAADMAEVLELLDQLEGSTGA